MKDAEALIEELEELKSDFEQPPEIIIISNEDLPDDDLVIAKLDEQQGDPSYTSYVKTEECGSGITIVICHAKITDLDKTPFQVLTSFVTSFFFLQSRQYLLTKTHLVLLVSNGKTFQTKERVSYLYRSRRVPVASTMFK